MTGETKMMIGAAESVLGKLFSAMQGLRIARTQLFLGKLN
jgi:hypothetical protein